MPRFLLRHWLSEGLRSFFDEPHAAIKIHAMMRHRCDTYMVITLAVQ